jgi:hypothetical protein
MVGTLQDAILRAKQAKGGDSLDTDDDFTLLNRDTTRLELPLTSVVAQRRVAALLRGLAEQLEFLSQRTDIPPHSILFQVWQSARQTNRKLRAMRRKRGEKVVEFP